MKEEKKCFENSLPVKFIIMFSPSPSCGCGSAALIVAAALVATAAAVRGEATGILQKSHKVKKSWKKPEHGVKKAKLFIDVKIEVSFLKIY